MNCPILAARRCCSAALNDRAGLEDHAAAYYGVKGIVVDGIRYLISQFADDSTPVSYTHLTLPTICSV